MLLGQNNFATDEKQHNLKFSKKNSSKIILSQHRTMSSKKKGKAKKPGEGLIAPLCSTKAYSGKERLNDVDTIQINFIPSTKS